eukprot:CAMPEP_0184859730 /NCGR_PEP_ID=MMETSP0580-20130426/4717_1 /TAXON_ID=1118495 /ORGANISM="Dactyliosolen fragilissimus" /LENGTH=681 /DNA_ID=CAMNT_0027356531 /DNA_START=296 /DNA_END=2341 /DNA_ORIENTATION=+
MDDRPEWRDYDTPDELAKGLPSAARCGLIPIDDSKYIGGLQPTRISRAAFGGSYGHGSAESCAKEAGIRRRLAKTNRTLDSLMERQFKKKLEETKLVVELQKKRKRNIGDNPSGGDDVPYNNDDHLSNFGSFEHESLIRLQEAEATRSQLSLNAEKYSLDRALLLHGKSHEIPDKYTQFNPLSGQAPPSDIHEQKEVLWKQLDASQRNISHDIYHAYRIIMDAIKMLRISNVYFQNEVIQMTIRFAALNQGFSIKGIKKTLQTFNYDLNHTNQSSMNHNSRKEQLENLREYNKIKEIASLGAAFVYLACKKFSVGRTLPQICDSFQTCHQYLRNNNISNHDSSNSKFVKLKYCSKAMNEIKSIMSDYIRSITDAAHPKPLHATLPSTTKSELSSPDSIKSTASTPILSSSENGHSLNNRSFPNRHTQEDATMESLVHHTIQQLELPPAAILAITKLVVYLNQKANTCHEQNIFTCIGSNVKPITLIASITYLMSIVGSTMKKLAGQALATKSISSSEQQTSRLSLNQTNILHQSKRQKIERWNKENSRGKDGSQSCSGGNSNRGNSDTSHSFTKESKSSILQDDLEERDTMRCWYEWSLEKSWCCDTMQLTAACKTGNATIQKMYKKILFPNRHSLLNLLEKYFSNPSNNTSVSNIHISNMDLLMNNISIAASVITATSKP